VSAAASAAGVSWFVGGATARDILPLHRFGVEPSRATKDVDIGVSIGSWQGDRELRDALIATGRFTQNEKQAQRLDYHATNTGQPTWLDIVPFGGLEREGESEIAWPPDGAFRLNVKGFEEALNAAVPVELEPDLVVLVASLPALAMLKILAWLDRHKDVDRDAVDLRFLLATYSNAGNMDRLYGGDAEDLLMAFDYDPDMAGAALLARDLMRLTTPAIRGDILDALAPAEAYPLILTQMMGGGHRVLDFGDDKPGFIEALFNAFRVTILSEAESAT
jgi:predicted nucleotidyltransferase